MDQKVGIWIDHKRAVIVRVSAHGVIAETLESGVGPHGRYSGPAGHATSDGGHEGEGEKNFEERYGRHLERYYDQVISQLGEPEALLILGPGRAKRQLEERLRRFTALSERIVGTETMGPLTNPQIVARVKEHFETGTREDVNGG